MGKDEMPGKMHRDIQPDENKLSIFGRLFSLKVYHAILTTYHIEPREKAHKVICETRLNKHL